jgi:uncharacterized protein with von Willebrand factor type A (vWA) domain
MRARILEFVDTLRSHAFAISVAETMDALEAVGAAGVERPVLREALAATLVKDERDRAAFDRLFGEAFPLGERARPAAARRRRRAEGGGRGGAGGRTGGGFPRDRRPREPDEPSEGRGARPDARGRGDTARERAHARRHALLRKPFRELDPREVDELRGIVDELAKRLRGRLARRERRLRHGRLDVRRMLRASVATGGTPIRVVRRGRRPDRPDLLALVDLSGSVAVASELCLALLAPAAPFFRRVHTLAYVDRLVPVAFEHGCVVPDGMLDLHARSDFGRVLVELETRRAHLLRRHTLVVVLGDARNNRLPPRADVLRRVRERTARLVWLVPEPRVRWNTGDSVLARYAAVCDAVHECVDAGALLSALRRTL